MGVRRAGGGGASVGRRPPWKIFKKKVKKNVENNFNLQKVPIVCYARKFHHNLTLCVKFVPKKAPMICIKFLPKKAPPC